MRTRVSGLLIALLALATCARAGGWIAFAAPEMAHTRAQFAELQQRAASDLQAHGLELRFVATPENDEAVTDRQMVRTVSEAPALIVAVSTRIALSAKRATNVVPIVFASVADPVRTGLVESLAYPGRNLTGFTYDAPVETKQLELLGEIAPAARTIGVLEDGHWLDQRVSRDELRALERRFGKSIRVFRAASAAEMTAAIESAEGRKMDAWLVPISDTAANGRHDVVAALRKSRKAAVYGRGFFVDAGGLAAYQEVVRNPIELLHTMIRSILAGTPPSRIPIQRPKDFELTLNLAASRREGIKFPPYLLKRANRVVVDD